MEAALAHAVRNQAEAAYARSDLFGRAAKNHQDVLAVADPADYPEVAQQLAERTANYGFWLHLAAKAFAHTAAYDAAIAHYLQALAGTVQT